eukprot:5170010-Prymnesium_polylepis.1
MTSSAEPQSQSSVTSQRACAISAIIAISEDRVIGTTGAINAIGPIGPIGAISAICAIGDEPDGLRGRCEGWRGARVGEV